MSERPMWTPEEIAALVEGLVDEAADRRRLEEAIARDPEARQWAEQLRADQEALGEALHARIAARPAAEFQRQVMQRIARQARPAGPWPLVEALRRWRTPILGFVALALMVIALPLVLKRLTSPVVRSYFTAPPPAAQRESPAIPECFVDGEMEVALANLPPANLPRESAVPSTATSTPTPAELPPATPPAPAQRGPALAGLVRDDRGNPLAEATVVLRAHVPVEPAGEEVTLAAAVSDFGGRYDFDDPFALARAQGLEGRVLRVVASLPGRAAVQTELSDTVPKQDIDFDLPSGQTLRGAVTDPQGQPVAGLTVRIADGKPTLTGQAVLETATEADGTFALSGLASGEHRLWLMEPGEIPQPPVAVVAEAATPARLVWRAHDQFAIEGHVLGAINHRAVQGTRVLLRHADPEGGEPARIAWTHTDESGAFEFECLAPGTPYSVAVDSFYANSPAVQVTGEPWHSGELILTDSAPVAEVTLLGADTVTLSGRAVDVATGEGVPSLTLVIGRGGPSVKTDAEGRFALAGFEPSLDVEITVESSEWTLAGKPSGVFPLRHVISLYDQPDLGHLAVPVQRGSPVSGEVTDADGRPVVGAEVHLVDVTEETGFSTVIAHTDESGRFAAALPPDLPEFGLFVRAEGWPLAVWSPPHPPSPSPARGEGGSGTGAAQFTLGPSLELRARVEDSAGQPLAHALILADPMMALGNDRPPLALMDPGLSLRAESDGRGLAEFSGVPLVPLRLTTRASGRSPAVTTVSPASAEGGVIETTVVLEGIGDRG